MTELTLIVTMEATKIYKGKEAEWVLQNPEEERSDVYSCLYGSAAAVLGDLDDIHINAQVFPGGEGAGPEPDPMPYEERREIYLKAIETFGHDSQMKMALEEMAELSQAICKCFRGTGELDNLVEEISDVTIMLEQLRIMFDINDEVRKAMSMKAERLRKRLEELSLGGEQ